jgi:type IX secretion system PorP/SprF family membrane protein
MKKRLIIAIVVVMGGWSAHAQQDAMFTHYMYNTMSVNPAYAGSRDALTITSLNRFQWVGFKGAPMTQNINVHMPLWSNRLGVGVSVMNDKIGPSNKTSVEANFAYRLKLNAKTRLAFGLKGGLNMLNASLLDVKTTDANDQSFGQGINSRMLPNFGFGLLLQHDNFYIGASIPKLLENDFSRNTTTGGTDFISEQRHYFFIAGAAWKLNRQLMFKPSTLVKVVTGAPVQLDLTANFVIDEVLTLGGMYRSTDALGVLVGVNVKPQFYIGYSFDFSTGNRTFKYNNGSHELMLRYDFIFSRTGKIKSPRYF